MSISFFIFFLFVREVAAVEDQDPVQEAVRVSDRGENNASPTEFLFFLMGVVALIIFSKTSV